MKTFEPTAVRYVVNMILNTNLDLDEIRSRFEIKFSHLSEDELDEWWDEALDSPELST